MITVALLNIIFLDALAESLREILVYEVLNNLVMYLKYFILVYF